MAGPGAVELVAADVPRSALLLERLDSSRSLASIPVAEAAVTAGALVRTLAIEAFGSFPSLQATARQLAVTLQARQRWLQDPLPGQWVTLATRLVALDPGRRASRAASHHRLLDILVENGQLNRTKAIAWGFVRSIDYWLWGLKNGLTMDPLRCQRVAGALEPEARQVSL